MSWLVGKAADATDEMVRSHPPKIRDVGVREGAYSVKGTLRRKMRRR